jgi:putative inorganic carbon (HCO3(-)) transporter
MPIKTILFLAGFLFCCVGALVAPVWGVVGNVLYYIMGKGWWTAPITHWGLRYSYILTIATAIGVSINWSKLRFGKPILLKQEILILVFLAIVWISTAFGETTTAASYIVSEHPSLKLSKFIILSFLISHIVTHLRNLNVFFWALILGTIHLGIRAYQMPQSAFISGRLENIGGSDFRQANELAAFLAVMMPIIGIMFLKTHWPGKILCTVCGILALNAMVLTRSRAGLLGLIGGALILALFIPKRHRIKIIACLIVAGIGFFSLMDPRFITRSKTILQGTEIQDRSAQIRLDIWQGGYEMIKDNPMGVGAGNFMQNIGYYSRQGTIRDIPINNRDAHNTYIRCAAELGLQGIALLLVLIINAVVMLRKIQRRAAKLPPVYRAEFQMVGSAIAASLAVFIFSGLTSTLLYMEALWWWLLLPVCLQRCLHNQLAEIAEKEKPEETSRSISAKSPVG